MLLIESCLTVAALVIALAFPKVGARWFEVCEGTFLKLAQRRGLAVLVVGLTALASGAAGPGAITHRLTLIGPYGTSVAPFVAPRAGGPV